MLKKTMKNHGETERRTTMQAYAVYYIVRTNNPKWRPCETSELADAKNREFAIKKVKRKVAKSWRINEEDVEITRVAVIGYY